MNSPDAMGGNATFRCANLGCGPAVLTVPPRHSRRSDTNHDAFNSQLAQLRAEELETQINQAKNQQAVDRLIREMSRREADFQLRETYRVAATKMYFALAGVFVLTVALVAIFLLQRAKLRTACQKIAA